MSSTRAALQNTLLALVASVFALTLFIAFDFLVAQTTGSATRELTLDEKPYLAKSHGWYELKRGFVGQDQWGNRKYSIHTDEYGFRKKPNAESQSRYDIIFLGDSFTYGVNGSWEESFVGMYSDDTGRKVINAGVASYSPSAYLYQYKRAIDAPLLPNGHTVVIALDVSDVQDESGYWIDGDSHPRKRDEELSFKAAQEPNEDGSIRVFMRDSLPYTTLLYRYIRYGLFSASEESGSSSALTELPRSAFTHANWTELDKTVPYKVPSGFAPLGVRGGLEKLEQKLVEIARIAAQRDAEIYFLIYPWPAQIAHKDKFSWSDFVARVCKNISCAGVIDTIPTFRQLAETDNAWLEKYYLEGDMHFNQEGNRILADALLSRLSDTR